MQCQRLGKPYFLHFLSYVYLSCNQSFASFIISSRQPVKRVPLTLYLLRLVQLAWFKPPFNWVLCHIVSKICLPWVLLLNLLRVIPVERRTDISWSIFYRLTVKCIPWTALEVFTFEDSNRWGSWVLDRPNGNNLLIFFHIAWECIVQGCSSLIRAYRGERVPLAIVLIVHCIGHDALLVHPSNDDRRRQVFVLCVLLHPFTIGRDWQSWFFALAAILRHSLTF